MSYKVKEIFYSLQGEGAYSGYPAVFVRFSGCNLKCAFCDTEFKNGGFYTKEQLEFEVEKLTNGNLDIIIVLTGGEPCLQLQDNEPLFTKYRTHLETNGTQQIPKWINYITISPKNDLNLCDFNREPNELKILFDTKRVSYFKSIEKQSVGKSIKLYIQPLETHRKTNIDEAVDFIKQNPKFKLSLQTHKMIRIR